MSILDDAIREHLELKRAHGADDTELKRLEDEAFGPPQRPDEIDPFGEAPTEFLSSPGETAADAPAIADEHQRSGRRPDIADLQEPPAEAADPRAAGAEAAPGPSPADPARMPPPAPEGAAGPASVDAAASEDEHSPAPDAPPPSPADAADLPLPPPPGGAPAADLAPPTGEVPAAAGEPQAPPTDEAPAAPAEEGAPAFFDQFSAPPTDEEEAPALFEEPPAPPADEAAAEHDEEHPAGEHEVVADPGPTTEERAAIADQPTQMFDVQAHVDAEAATDAPATGERESPSDEDLLDAAQEQPQDAPPAPEETSSPAERLEQPPLESRGPDAEIAGHPPAEAEPEEGSAEFDFFNEQRLSDELDQALEAPLPPTDEHLAMPRYEDRPAEEGGGIFDFESRREERPYEDDPSQEVLRRADEAEAAEEPAGGEEPETDYDPDTGHEDVLEDTPRFLEDQPEDDDLWFEQKPPKDFDLD
jgi:hypothetical protein